MKKEPIYVAFSTQKGGAGKTTLTVLAASYLHYEMGYNVAIIDCDFPQHSIHSMRKRDLSSALENEFYKGMIYELFTRLGKKAYPVVGSSIGSAINDAEKVTFMILLHFEIINSLSQCIDEAKDGRTKTKKQRSLLPICS